jgi:hypothetical protein
MLSAVTFRKVYTIESSATRARHPVDACVAQYRPSAMLYFSCVQPAATVRFRGYVQQQPAAPLTSQRSIPPWTVIDHGRHHRVPRSVLVMHGLHTLKGLLAHSGHPPRLAGRHHRAVREP